MSQKREKYNTIFFIISTTLFLVVMLDNIIEDNWFDSLAYVLSFFILCFLIFISIKQKRKSVLVIFLILFLLYIFNNPFL
jgi:thiol:disulfide interchange protein